MVEEALRAARRVNDYSTAVRIFEGLSKSPPSPRNAHSDSPRNAHAEEKVENPAQYEQYVAETKPLREELGVLLREELYSIKA